MSDKKIDINKVEQYVKDMSVKSKSKVKLFLKDYVTKHIKAFLPETAKKKISESDIKKMVEKQKMSGESLEEIVKNYREIVTPLIVNEMKEYLGDKLDNEGLKYASKSLGSLQVKVQREWVSLTDFKQKEYGNMVGFAKNAVRDAIRFTVNTTMDTFYNDWKNLIIKLKSNGYECIRVSNTWLAKNATYFGVNMSFLSPFGYVIEVQMHTPEDKKVWKETHGMYEAGRTKEASKFQKEVAAAAQQMVIKRHGLDKLRPNGIEKINLENAKKLQ